MIVNVLSILAGILGLSALIVVHEAGHYLAARRAGIRVDRFSVGFGKVLFSFRRRETEFAVSLLPLGGYVAIHGMATGDEVKPDDATAYANKPAWRRFLVILAGPAINYVLAVVIAAGLLLSAGLATPDPAARVGAVTPDRPAAQAGLQTGERIRSVAGVPVDTFAGLVAELQRHPGKAITLEVERGEGAAAERRSVQITPRDEHGVGRVGFGQHELLQRADGIVGATAEAFSRTNAVLAAQVSAFGRLFSRGGAAGVMGPLGILELLMRAAQDGPGRFLALLWLLSAVLAVFNLFPFPGLDGARLMFLGYELVTRRRVNAKVENTIHMAGMIALFALIIGVTVFGDLARLRGK